MRWARTTRLCRPLGHLGLLFTHGVVPVLLYLFVSGFSPLAWRLLAVMVALQTGSLAFVGGRVLGDTNLRRCFWLLPLWDVLGWGIWFASLFGSTVVWRGTRFRLYANGKMEPYGISHLE